MEEAFEDNHAPAVPVDCDQDEATIVMVYPAPSIVPGQKAAVTPSGKPTIHKRSKTEQNELYAQSLASNILATVREGFAVAPRLRRIVILSVAKDTAVGGVPTLSALTVTGFDRAHVDQFNWDRLDAWRTVEAATPALMNRRGRTGELAPLDLTRKLLDRPREATLDEPRELGTVVKRTHPPLVESRWVGVEPSDVDGVDELLLPDNEDGEDYDAAVDALSEERLALVSTRGHVDRAADELRTAEWHVTTGRASVMLGDRWFKNVMLVDELELPHLDDKAAREALTPSRWL